MNSNDITDTMIAELYKLNYINKMKMRFISKTIKAFGASIIILVIVLAYVGIVNMMNVVNKQRQEKWQGRLLMCAVLQ